MLKAVLFDLDDTLIDWSGFSGQWEVIEASNVENVYRYLRGVGNPSGNAQMYRESYFRRARAVWESVDETQEAPHIGRVLVEAAEEIGIPASKIDMRACLEVYGWGSSVNGVQVFPDTKETLSLLRRSGVRRGIITNGYAPMWMRDHELKHFGLLEYFPECRFSSADEGKLKPHPHMFQKALACLDARPQEVIFVGDSLSADVAGAQGVGMRAVHRARTSSQAYDDPVAVAPDATLHSLCELPEILNQWFPGWDKQNR